VTTPDQLLASSGWRRRHSIYTLWAFFFGFGFISLFYTGLRAKKNDWVVWGVVYGLIVIGALTIGGSLAPQDPDAPTPLGVNLVYGAWLIVWIVSAMHVFRARKEWLRWKAAAAGQARWFESSPTVAAASAPTPDLNGLGLGDPTSEYLAGPPSVAPPLPSSSPSRRPLQPPPTTPPPTGPDLRLPPPPVDAAHDEVPGAMSQPVDLNTASVEEIAALPGVGVAAARRIVDERQRRAGFGSVDEAAVAADLQPHVRSRLQKLAAVSERQPPKRRGTVGRIVDI
jgi:Helix-hairpin-helix motif